MMTCFCVNEYAESRLCARIIYLYAHVLCGAHCLLCAYAAVALGVAGVWYYGMAKAEFSVTGGRIFGRSNRKFSPP